MGEHPLLGDYENNKFGAAGFAVCHPGTPLPSEEGRIAINAPNRHSRGLVIDDAPPDGHPQRRYRFEGIPFEQIRRNLPWRDGQATSRLFVEGSGIGGVDHVIGRSVEDYRDEGSTSQDLADCNLIIFADPSGIQFEFAGSLSEQGFLRPVAPSLRQASYTVRCRMPWPASRFFFDANTLFLLYRARGVVGGEVSAAAT